MKRLLQLLPWLSAFVLLAGAFTAAVVILGGGSDDEGQRTAATPAARTTPAKAKVRPQQPRTQAKRKLRVDPKARQVAARFILSAAGRNDLAAAWKLAGPGVRQGMSYKEWLTGNIPVPYYPSGAIDVAPMAVQELRANEVYLEVALMPKRRARIKGQVFIIGVKAVGNGAQRRWVVDYFAPYTSIGRPVQD